MQSAVLHSGVVRKRFSRRNESVKVGVWPQRNLVLYANRIVWAESGGRGAGGRPPVVELDAVVEVAASGSRKLLVFTTEWVLRIECADSAARDVWVAAIRRAIESLRAVPVVVEEFGPGEEQVGTRVMGGDEAVRATRDALMPLVEALGVPPPFVTVREVSALGHALRPFIESPRKLDERQREVRAWWASVKRYYASRVEAVLCTGTGRQTDNALIEQQ